VIPFADVSFSTEAIVVISAILLALVGAIGALYWQNQKATEARVTSLSNRLSSYEQISERAMEVLLIETNAKLAAEGRALPPILAAVVPEHHSPMTFEQEETAKLATRRAQLTAITLALGLPARE
jgi:hypothetical protein